MGGGAMMESLGFIALCLAGGLILWNRWQTKHTMAEQHFPDGEDLFRGHPAGASAGTGRWLTNGEKQDKISSVKCDDRKK